MLVVVSWLFAVVRFRWLLFGVCLDGYCLSWSVCVCWCCCLYAYLFFAMCCSSRAAVCCLLSCGVCRVSIVVFWVFVVC